MTATCPAPLPTILRLHIVRQLCADYPIAATTAGALVCTKTPAAATPTVAGNLAMTAAWQLLACASAGKKAPAWTSAAIWPGTAFVTAASCSSSSCRQASQLHRHVVATRGRKNDFGAFEPAANRCQVILNLRGDGHCQLPRFPAPGSPSNLLRGRPDCLPARRTVRTMCSRDIDHWHAESQRCRAVQAGLRGTGGGRAPNRSRLDNGLGRSTVVRAATGPTAPPSSHQAPKHRH